MLKNDIMHNSGADAEHFRTERSHSEIFRTGRAWSGIFIWDHGSDFLDQDQDPYFRRKKNINLHNFMFQNGWILLKNPNILPLKVSGITIHSSLWRKFLTLSESFWICDWCDYMLYKSKSTYRWSIQRKMVRNLLYLSIPWHPQKSVLSFQMQTDPASFLQENHPAGVPRRYRLVRAGGHPLLLWPPGHPQLEKKLWCSLLQRSSHRCYSCWQHSRRRTF